MLVNALNSAWLDINDIRFYKCIKSTLVLSSVQSDLGITLNGSTVSAWADQASGGVNFTQGTAANQPTFVQSVLNGYPAVRFDGVNDVLVASKLILPAPGTTPSWFWAVFKGVTDPAGGGRIFSPNISTNCMLGLTGGAGPVFSVSQFNAAAGVNSVSTLTTGTFLRLEMYYSNSTNDYCKLGPSTKTGSSAGNTSTATARSMGAQPSEPDAYNFDMFAYMVCQGLPSDEDRYSLDQAIMKKYGGLVAI